MLADKLKLYAITDRRWLAENGYTLETAVEEAILSGATILQLREKELDFDAFLSEAKAIKKITNRYKIPLIINDNIEVAIACGADGVHLGQEDLIGKSIAEIRQKFGKNKIIGISANTLEEAIEAERNGADYLGIDTPFATATKLDYKNASFDEMKKITSTVKIPCCAIGGVNAETIPLLAGTGVAGYAMISAIFAEKNIRETVAMLKKVAKYNSAI
ncbi:MAG: thiamine phosphate synthase [Rickettsiales bacterium]|nr:thiamine phosphate synthase [Rickettsiales bacterium]